MSAQLGHASSDTGDAQNPANLKTVGPDVAGPAHRPTRDRLFAQVDDDA
ncbi:hypothetical protein [Streptomyces sp. NPDC048481]